MDGIRSLSCIALLSVSGGFASAEEADSAPAEADGTIVKVDGAVLTYVARTIPRNRRHARGELETIGRATAAIHVEKGIASRSDKLPAGSYRLKVETDDGHKHFLVLEPEAAGDDAAEPEEAPRPRTRKPSRNKDGAKPVLKSGNGTEEPAEEEGREAKEATGARKGKQAKMKAKEKVDPAGKTPERKPRAVAGEGVEDRDGDETPRIRAPLALSPCEKLSDALVFELKALRRGTKLRITVRAGGTAGRATLRFGDIQGPLPVGDPPARGQERLLE
ncbi:MAG TPA: hypothetical protein VMT52_19325 [Planctomycetota bacterium]|nr:hypothetical protein [Planctomycetota bacterium]